MHTALHKPKFEVDRRANIMPVRYTVRCCRRVLIVLAEVRQVGGGVVEGEGRATGGGVRSEENVCQGVSGLLTRYPEVHDGIARLERLVGQSDGATMEEHAHEWRVVDCTQSLGLKVVAMQEGVSQWGGGV